MGAWCSQPVTLLQKEHLLLAREARGQDLQVLLTHPGNIPQLTEAAKLGAFIEMNASGINRSQEAVRAAVEMVRQVGAESILLWRPTVAR